MRRILLGHVAGVKPADLHFGKSDRGKPCLPDAGIEFNTSHTRDVGVIVTGQAPLGVDIEALDRSLDYLRFAQRTFTEEEYLDIREHRGDDLRLAFFNCWTGKEAYIKAIGLGLTKDLRSFSVHCMPGNAPGLRWDRESDEDPTAWQFESIPIDNHVATIVANSATGQANVCERLLSTESLRAGLPVSLE